jgi:tRNA dimethylallyltransferase
LLHGDLHRLGEAPQKSQVRTVKALFLLGPTASGKSSLALWLADQLKGERQLEIISVDSALVYRGMDIGTAKPSQSEQSLVPHHLIDVIEPNEAYSAARFQEDASQLIRAIHARGHFPLIVGGTMLYVKALSEGMHELPVSDPTVRAQVLEEAKQRGWPAMHELLRQVDAVTAARLPPHDAQRIGRALELFRQTGRSMSIWLAGERPGLTPDFSFDTLSLEPSNRSVLHQRIAQRFKAMLDQGFLDEMHRLRARGDLHQDMASMRCVGYRQAWDWLDRDSATPIEQMIDLGVIATRQLAKRQLTWLRSMPERHIIDCLDPRLNVFALEYLRRAIGA